MISKIKFITSTNALVLQNAVNEFLADYEEQYVKITTTEINKKAFHTAIIKYKMPEYFKED